MLNSEKISKFYSLQFLNIPRKWSLSRKHYRVQTLDYKFVKINKFENRINLKELREHCIRFTPLHVYFSVLNYLFPERVGKKYKANYAVPINGEYVIDIDSYLLRRWHKHTTSKTWKVCNECLENSKYLAINVCEQLERYYTDLSVVFSGKSGFHVHVHDFKVNDWTKYNEKNPIKSHEVSRFKLTKSLNLDVECFDRYHFVVSSDPMRIISVPETLNAENGLICKYIGDRKDLERKSISQIIKEAVPFGSLYGYPEPLFFRGYEINA